jgi:hypothetical protein
MKTRKKLLLTLVTTGLIAFLVSSAYAATESITVEAGKEVSRTINLAAGDRTSITFTVTGPIPSTLHFYVVLPNGTTVNYGEANQLTTNFFTDVKGECQLNFDNSNTSDSQLVTLNYDVEHFILGIPQLVFLLVAIAALLLVVVAGYIIMGKYG